MRRFYCPFFPEQGHVCLPDEEARHLVRVLRANVGDEIQLMDGKGKLATAKVSQISGSRSTPKVTVEIDSYESIFFGANKICLYVACPRTKQIELILRQATELGVSEIHPIVTEFTVSRPDKNADKWTNVLIEAMKQSGNPFVPTLFPVTSFDQALSDDAPGFGFYGAVPTDEDKSEVKVVEADISLHRVAIWIGPEGGFSANELDNLRRKTVEFDNGITQRCYQPMVIGHHILRIETAVTASIATVINTC